MSTLLDQINANTEAIKTGKNTVVDAITAKGGVVNSSGSVPTFKEIANGVSSINTSGGGSSGGGTIVETVVTAGTGAVRMTGTAIGSVAKYDTIKVVESSGEVSYMGSNVLPTEGRTNLSETEYTTEQLSYAKVVQGVGNVLDFKREYSDPHMFYASPDNSLICVGSASSYKHYFPFFLVNGKYKQLKINNNYQPFPGAIVDGALSTSDGSDFMYLGNYGSYVAYDAESQLLFVYSNNISVYKLDEAELNLKPLVTATGQHTDLVAYRHHIFYRKMMSTTANTQPRIYMKNFDEETNTFGTETTISQSFGSGSTNAMSLVASVVNIIPIADDYVYVLLRSISSTAYNVTKLHYNNNTNIFDVVYTGTMRNNNFYSAMPDAYRILSVKTGEGLNAVHYFDSGSGDYTGTEDVSALFLDDVSVFDPSTITKFRIDQDGYMVATDGTDWFLLKTDFIDGVMTGYKLLTKINESFTPLTSGGNVGGRLVQSFKNGYFIKSKAGELLLYKEVVEGGAYRISKANNKIPTESVYGIGIALEDINSGEEGTVSLSFLS